MKLATLSEKVLKLLVTRYKETGNDTTLFGVIKESFQDVQSDLLNKALYKLQYDGFISIFDADDVAYSSTLLPQAIIEVEENTLLTKGYKAFKEIKDLLTLI